MRHTIPARVFSWLKLTELKSTKIVSPSAHTMLSYFTCVLPQLPRPVHEEPLQPHSAHAVAHFGRLAEQSPITGYEPKGLMTAGGDAANTTLGRSSICSMTTQGDHSTTPSAGHKWESSDISLASQLLSQNREGSGDGLPLYHTSREASSHPLESARENSLQGFFCMALTQQSQVESK